MASKTTGKAATAASKAAPRTAAAQRGAASKRTAGTAAPRPARKTAAPRTGAAPRQRATSVAPAVRPDTAAPARKRDKLLRDGFTIPKSEFAVLQALKDRAAALGRPAKKSEVLRAGIKALAAMSDAKLRAALRAVPALKTGRPAGSDADAARA